MKIEFGYNTFCVKRNNKNKTNSYSEQRKKVIKMLKDNGFIKSNDIEKDGWDDGNWGIPEYAGDLDPCLMTVGRKWLTYSETFDFEIIHDEKTNNYTLENDWNYVYDGNMDKKIDLFAVTEEFLIEYRKNLMRRIKEIQLAIVSANADLQNNVYLIDDPMEHSNKLNKSLKKEIDELKELNKSIT